MTTTIRWPSTITYTIDSTLDFGTAAIERAFATWQSVLPHTFESVTLGGDFVAAPLQDVLQAFAIDWQPVAVNVTMLSATGTGIASYIGLDLQRAIDAGWEPWVVALHEIGHAFGLADQPSVTGAESLYGYAAPHATGLTADAIEFVQDRFGASPRADRIEVTGVAHGRIAGGAGADTIVGAAGNEVIYGNQQSDFIVGGAGDDVAYGGQDDDVIAAGDGHDLLYGNLGADTLSGGPGFDCLYGGQDADVLHAGPGDTVFGGLGPDVLYLHPLALIGQYDPQDTVLFVGT